MDDAKKLGREARTGKKTVRAADGTSVEDRLGNAGDQARESLGNAGDRLNEAAHPKKA